MPLSCLDKGFSFGADGTWNQYLKSERRKQMELWDVYDHCFQKTGRLHERGNPLPSGEYHLVVAVYPVNSQGQVLIQRRNFFR